MFKTEPPAGESSPPNFGGSGLAGLDQEVLQDVWLRCLHRVFKRNVKDSSEHVGKGGVVGAI